MGGCHRRQRRPHQDRHRHADAHRHQHLHRRHSINGGTLAISADANLGAAAGTLSFNGGTLQFGASALISRSITLNAGGGTIDTNGNGVAVAGIIGGPGGLTKNGAGVLTFTAPMTYSGGTTINAGMLALSDRANNLAARRRGHRQRRHPFPQATPSRRWVRSSGTGAASVDLGAAGTLTTNSAANTTLASPIDRHCQRG